ncbi:hypothetical protein [Bradyrhizobium sp. AUGA SZCCT0431]|uniref:hypothetical protein n=1 Tax=Bradyrhizobium sp. AUGA SZCCT0431 TaxID=2807674 RepID=UPI001BA8DDDE|nr:hypothetical protein [Bradyrhizobium sp. AUGA SZCCT0431]MBR1144116.1 hypothetical protein [Bradyrhizobium sp. AUGA SZCCT0431]
MQDKVGGVMPAGLFLFIARRAELLAIVRFMMRLDCCSERPPGAPAADVPSGPF